MDRKAVRTTRTARAARTTRTARTTRAARTVAAAVALSAPLLALAPAAHAGGTDHDLDVRHAYTSWLFQGPADGIPGNVHRGVVSASWDDDPTSTEGPSLYVEPWMCPEGVEPPALGEVNGEEPVDTPCTFEGLVTADLADASVEVDAWLRTAHVSGSATVNGVQLPVDVTWNGSGRTERDVWVDHEAPEDGGRTSITVLSWRSATATGAVGDVQLTAGMQTRTSLLRQDVTFHAGR